MFHTRIAGTGSYLPERILSNFELEKMVDTNDQWIRERTGIESRHLAVEGETTSDLAYKASLKALEAAGMKPADLDMIIFATVTGDQVLPATACFLQDKLGCKSIPAFDLAAACTGFIYGLTIADQFIRTGMYKNILVVGAEILHNYVNYKDRETCILFGDGAGAFVVSRAQPGEVGRIMSSHLKAEGSLAELLTVDGLGSKKPLNAGTFNSEASFIKMKGREIYKNAVRVMSQCAQEALEFNKTAIADVAWLIPHQANTRIMEAVANHFDFPQERVINILKDMGNTSSATVPIAFDTGIRDGRIKRGQTILMTAFGGGLTSGSMLLVY